MKKTPPTRARAEIHLVNLEGTADRTFTPTAGRCVAPAFAPAGKPCVAFIEQGSGTDRLRVFSAQGKPVVDFEMKGLRAFAWDVSGASLYALGLTGRSRGRIAVCDIASAKQHEATVVASADEASLATSPEKGTAWLAGKNPDSRITGLFKMKSTGSDGPWSLGLRMPGPWSSIAVHPVSGLVHGLLHIEGALQLVNEGKPRSPLEIFFKGVHATAVHHHQVALNSNGSMIAFLHDGELHVVGAPGTKPRKLTVSGKSECGPPVWHPDGKRIACVRDGAIHLVDVNAGTSKAIAGALAADDRVAFSPDGREVAYSRAMN
jgi:hypothetical protein